MGRVNKLKIALVTDSTSVLTKQEVSDNNITVVPIPVIVGDKEYLEGVNITSAQLFEIQRQGAAFPKTSQPSMGEMIGLCNKLHSEGYEAIMLLHYQAEFQDFTQI